MTRALPLRLAHDIKVRPKVLDTSELDSLLHNPSCLHFGPAQISTPEYIQPQLLTRMAH